MRLFCTYGIRIAIVLLAISLGGCVTYYYPQYADDGVYYGDDYYDRYGYGGAVVDPVYYPYWSLDYFYFSYYRHPYSVVLSHDPFFRPYPGWYYGYRPGYRFRFSAGLGYWYPWYGAGFYYHYYRPWYWNDHYHYHYHHHAKPAVERRQRAVAGARRDQRGRELYRAQQQDVRDSFMVRTDRRAALREDGIPRPYDRTPARRLAGDIAAADSDAARARARSRNEPARRPVMATDRRTQRTGAQPRREQRGIPIPQRRVPAQPRREAAPSRRVNAPVSPSVPSTPPVDTPAPARSEAPRRESAPPSRPSARPAPPPRESTSPSRGRSRDDSPRRRR